ncbi:hypothetical protein RRG08_067059 [Elysia crispata]|uniref:Uncharacterized protein n=1 Tax=Elysia crispata TaxID=231223 RepID=A0AAE1EBC9_9GAST|nr:hypothetical protein RRG08_067059 [Elysia crispata]
MARNVDELKPRYLTMRLPSKPTQPPQVRQAQDREKCRDNPHKCVSTLSQVRTAGVFDVHRKVSTSCPAFSRYRKVEPSLDRRRSAWALYVSGNGFSRPAGTRTSIKPQRLCVGVASLGIVHVHDSPTLWYTGKLPAEASRRSECCQDYEEERPVNRVDAWSMPADVTRRGLNRYDCDSSLEDRLELVSKNNLKVVIKSKAIMKRTTVILAGGGET